ncbi:unnamed protein product, partial [Prorocentrum cordatum]
PNAASRRALAAWSRPGAAAAVGLRQRRAAGRRRGRLRSVGPPGGARAPPCGAAADLQARSGAAVRRVTARRRQRRRLGAAVAGAAGGRAEGAEVGRPALFSGLDPVPPGHPR